MSDLGGMLGGLLGGGKGGSGNLIASLLQIMQGGGGSQGGGGLGSLLDQFRTAGLADKADSWVGTGQNKSLTGDEVEQAIGRERLDEVAHRAGVSTDEAKSGLAAQLPQVIDQLTPNGQLPATGNLQDMLGNLLGGGRS
jgi:uncharacterized protein YidB (DUF937 family)